MHIIKGLYRNIISLLYSNVYIYCGLFACINLLLYFSLNKEPVYTFVFALLPLVMVSTALALSKPYYLFVFFFTLNYFIMTFDRYVPNKKPGMIMLGFSIAFLLFLMIYSVFNKMEWKHVRTPFLFLWIVWMIYCSVQLFRRDVIFEAWAINIGTYAFYAICIAIFLPLIFHRYNDLKFFLFIWSIFIIIATLKGYWQNNFGFDSRELQWLIAEGGARTHFLRTGIRYFSIFTDAANYGTSNGFSFVVYAAAAFFLKEKWIRFYFFIITLMSLYGMLISGTRTATAIPFVGLTCFVLLSKHVQTIVSGTIIVVGAFIFLNYTTIGSGNRFIRRMRTSFDTEDASLILRQQNQAILKTYMVHHPFGVGLGLSAGQALRWVEKSDIPDIPPDSWLVMVWTETGIVGLVIYLIMNAVMYAWGAYILLFKVKNRELAGILVALYSGSLGIFVASYGNAILGFPNGMISSMAMVYVFLGPRLDKELLEEENAALESQKKLEDAKKTA